MKYYAYKVAEDGGEPVGSEGRLLFELKTDRGAIRRCHRMFGYGFRWRLFTYEDFQDKSTFRPVYRH
jgi:hypothetical protein